MRRAYRSFNFKPATLAVIQQANDIARTYAAQGFSLTLRQLYYRFVAQDLIPNRQSEYKRLGSIINDARYAGLFDWNWITDRTRNASGGDSGYDPDHPEEVIDPSYFHVTQWDGQPHRIEVWVEKDALVDVIQQGARGLRTVTFSCRGYTSSSEIHAAAQRIEGYLSTPSVEDVTILHLGDHDPSGIDMTRDITSRLKEFVRGDGYPSYRVNIKRIALNMDQIEQYEPPPNPAKETDSRFESYRLEHGDESWELDALEPRTLVDLIRSEIKPLIIPELWNERSAIAAKGQATLQAIRDNYSDLVQYLVDEGKLDPDDVEVEKLDDDETEEE